MPYCWAKNSAQLAHGCGGDGDTVFPRHHRGSSRRRRRPLLPYSPRGHGCASAAVAPTAVVIPLVVLIHVEVEAARQLVDGRLVALGVVLGLVAAVVVVARRHGDALNNVNSSAPAVDPGCWLATCNRDSSVNGASYPMPSNQTRVPSGGVKYLVTPSALFYRVALSRGIPCQWIDVLGRVRQAAWCYCQTDFTR